VRAALAPLAHREFRLLFVGRLTSLAGSAIAPIALAFAVLEITGSATDLGVVLAAGFVPQIVLFLFGGVIADRLPRHRVMVAADVIDGVVQLVAAVLVLGGTAEIWHLAVLNAVRGGATAFFFPAAQGLTPQTVPGAQLQEANALLRLTYSGTNIVGTALGGLLVAGVGPGWALGWDAATYFAGAAVIALMRTPSSRPEAADTSVLADLRDGWIEFASRTWLWAIVAAAALGNMATSMGWAVLGPVVADRELGGASAWGFILAALSTGFVVGGLLAFKFRPEHPLRAGQIALLLAPLGMAGLALGLPVWAVAAGALCAGIGLELFGVFWELSLQQHVPRSKLSRVSSYDALGSFLAIPVGQIVAGPLSDAIGVEPTIWVAVALFAVPTAACLLVGDVRDLRRLDLPATAEGEPQSTTA
jgi:MFS family permease